MTNVAEDINVAGLFEDEGRRNAVYGALPLLCTYFAEGQREKLRETEASISRREGNEDNQAADAEAIVAGLRLRVALALAKSLLRILDSVLDRPNFRYGVTRTVSLGAPRGKLDVTRWVSQLREVKVPESYPVLSVERSSLTPENLLACYSLMWFLEEIQTAYTTSSVPRKSRDSEQVIHTLNQIELILKRPDVSECRMVVARQGHTQWVHNLLEEVELRLGSGRVGNREPYEELVRWVRGVLAGRPSLNEGDVAWMFYDHSFDDKLFELWCMHQLASSLAHRIGERTITIPNLQTVRSRSLPAWEWMFGQHRLELRFQYSLSRCVPELAWKGDDGLKLDGRPDITLRLFPSGDSLPQIFFVDPKLRKRNGPPTDEIYKMLGYFSAAGMENAGKGVILYYTPHLDTQPTYDYRAARHGRVMAIGVDPARTEYNRAGFDKIATLIVPDGLIESESAER
ncbi:hypothetical protein ACQSME_30115 [Streptomyces sp. 2-6]|uniref:hypothetical protein n=1 Tax=Streptomyces sp. 2-6 TaxID=2978333 RepID=UPI003D0E76C1